MKRTVILAAILICSLCVRAELKYIFYFIGDGMGANQVLAAEMYLAELDGRIGRKQLCMTAFPYSGQLATFSDSNGITDSSAAGTCLATGHKSTNGFLGLDSKKDTLQSIAALLKKQGWGVGITTSVSIDHATPAAFYAHVDKRNNYYTIGTQLARSGYDFFAGGTFYQPNPKEGTGDNLYDLCEKNGYTIAHGYEEAQDKMQQAGKMIMIQAHEGLDRNAGGKGMIPYTIDRKESDMTLTQITQTAIDFLNTRYDRFFLMVEGGSIDWACHSNDAATAIREVIDMDEALQKAVAFYRQHPDETLIVVTADHETGGFALGRKGYTLNLQALQHQHNSSAVISEQLKAMQAEYGKKLNWQQVKDFFSETLGLYTEVTLDDKENEKLHHAYKKMMKHKDKDVKTLYSSLNELSETAVQLLNKKVLIGWTTLSHSASAVPVFSIGVGAERFTGWHDNSEVMPTMMQIVEENK